MRQQGYPGGCRSCRTARPQSGQDGLQLCLLHDVCTPDSLTSQPERYSIPVASLPERPRWDEVANTQGVLLRSSSDPHRYGATLPLEPCDMVPSIIICLYFSVEIKTAKLCSQAIRTTTYLSASSPLTLKTITCRISTSSWISFISLKKSLMTKAKEGTTRT